MAKDCNSIVDLQTGNNGSIPQPIKYTGKSHNMYEDSKVIKSRLDRQKRAVITVLFIFKCHDEGHMVAMPAPEPEGANFYLLKVLYEVG